MRTLKQGIYSAQEVPSSRYHADELCASPTLSSGLAKTVLLGNMEHARLAHPRLNKHYLSSGESKFSVGTAAHDLILEGGTGGKICVVDPELYRSEPTKANPIGNAATGWNNKAIKEFRDICIAEGKTPILKADFADVERMACSVHQAVAEETDLCGIRLNEEFGKPEQTIVWDENGVLCRARADFLTHDFTLCFDLKTTAARSPEHFERGFITQMGYDLSAEFYSRGIEQVTGVRPEWVWIVVQDFYPFSVFFCKPSQSMRDVARVKVDAAIRQWGECLASDKWPSWPRGIRSVEATGWAIAEAEEKLAAGENWHKDDVGAKEAFMCGSVHDEKTKAGSMADFDRGL